MKKNYKKHESLSSKDACAKIGWNWLGGSWEEDFLISSLYFRYFVIISPWKRAGPVIWTNLNPLHPRMLCAKFGWNWPSGSGEDFNFVNVLLLFCNYLPLEKGGALHLNKLKSPSPNDALCQVWLKLAQWSWRRRFLNFVNVFSLFHYYLPLEKGGALHLNKLESPSPKDALCQVWLKLDQLFWRRRFFNFVNVFSLFHFCPPLGKGAALYLNKI